MTHNDINETSHGVTHEDAVPSTPTSPERSSLRISKWISQDLDVFILSEAGKPIYCYSGREDAVTLMGVCTLLLNYLEQTQNDQMRFIRTVKGLKITFARKSPLIIVVVTKPKCGIDASIVVSQVNALVLSIFSGKTLKSIFEQRPTFDLKRLITGSEKQIENLIGLMSKPLHRMLISLDNGQTRSQSVRAFLSSPNSSSHRTINSQSVISRSTSTRVSIPITLLPSSVRDSITNIINSSSSGAPNVVFTLLFSVKKDEINLMTVCNHNSKYKLNPLDIQLIYTLVITSESQLSSVDSFWLPFCLPRFDANAFLHAHISYLNDEFVLVILTTDRENFHKCQLMKDAVKDRLEKVHLPASQSLMSDLSEHQLQYLWYQAQRQTLMWQQSSLCTFNPAIHYVADRMLQSHLKTFWMRSENEGVILGWHSPSFQLYAQFDVTITQLQALTAIQLIVKWIKKEEDKFILKDYP